MSSKAVLTGFAGAVIGALLAVAVVENPSHGEEDDSRIAEQLATLRAEVERQKGILPDQAHAMKDVDYHFTNLWFAGKAGNWPLADFYWKETLSHLRWGTRIIPIRKDSAGRDVNVQDILKGIENSPFMELGDTIREKDTSGFEVKYRRFLEACYTCHTSSEKPHLRLRVPVEPATRIIDFEPRETPAK